MKLLKRDSRGLPQWTALAGALVALALVLHSIFGPNGLATLRQKRREYQALSRQIQELKQENSSIEKDVQGLKSDPATIERYAREELHMARPGEIIYLLPREPSKSARTPHESRPSPKP